MKRSNSKTADRQGHPSFVPNSQRRRPHGHSGRTGIAPDAQTSARSEPTSGVREDLCRHKFTVTTPSHEVSIKLAIQVDPDRCTRQTLEILVKEEISKTLGEEAAKRFERIEAIEYAGEEPPK
jgi:hypothetical protein